MQCAGIHTHDSGPLYSAVGKEEGCLGSIVIRRQGRGGGQGEASQIMMRTKPHNIYILSKTNHEDQNTQLLDCDTLHTEFPACSPTPIYMEILKRMVLIILLVFVSFVGKLVFVLFSLKNILYIYSICFPQGK